VEAAPVTTQDFTAAISFIKSIVFHFFLKLFYCRGDPHSPLLLSKTHCTDNYKRKKEKMERKLYKTVKP
jgi:hypothetical protein